MKTALDRSALDIVVVGLNHHTAPVMIREQATVRPGEEETVLARVAPHTREVMLLATCNRTELYLVAPSADPVHLFRNIWGVELDEHLYVYRGLRAIEHLYSVTAGLNSQVIGETQIQGQVKRAWQTAQRQQTSGTLLNKAVQGALATGKRVRHETGMSDHVVSVSSAAVELATCALSDLKGRTALIIGAGETAELTLTHLRSAGVADVIVVNRTLERAQQLAGKLGGTPCPQESLNRMLPYADVVIASSAAPHYVLNAFEVGTALASRARPMVLIDISLPRNLNPDIQEVTGAFLYNLDDLTDIVSRNLQSRQQAVPHAEAIVREGRAELLRWHLTRQAQQRQFRERIPA